MNSIFKLNKEKIVIAVLLALIFAGRLFSNLSYAAGTAGSSADPLVTKSYVDDKVAALYNTVSSGTGQNGKVDVDSVVTDVMAQVEYLYGDKLKGGAGDKYVPVSASKGQIIIGDEGCEIILRSGSAICYTAVENGLVDATTGQELLNNTPISKNHILITPRADGRGVKTTEDAWFIIKGQYTILG